MVLYGYSLLASANPCVAQGKRLDAEILEYFEQTTAFEEIDRRFQESVKQDFNAQTEGLLDEIKRNEAVKIAFARKRLMRSMEVRREKLARARAEFCVNCRDVRESGGLPYCERCPNRPECNKAP